MSLKDKIVIFITSLPLRLRILGTSLALKIAKVTTKLSRPKPSTEESPTPVMATTPPNPLQAKVKALWAKAATFLSAAASFVGALGSKVKPVTDRLAAFVLAVVNFIRPKLAAFAALIDSGLSRFSWWPRLKSLWSSRKFSLAAKAILVLLLVALAANLLRGRLVSYKPRLTSAPFNSGYLYQSKTKDVSILLGNSSNKQVPKIKFSYLKSTIELYDADRTNPQATLAKTGRETLVYKNVYPSTDISYQVGVNRVKEEIIINQSVGVIPQYSFNFFLGNAAPKKALDGSLSPVFFNPVTGEYVFHFNKPFMVDAKGSRSDAVIMEIKAKEYSKSTLLPTLYTVTLKPDPFWLRDPKRAYPITIDPSISHTTSSDFSGGYFNRVVDTGSGSSPNLTTYYHELDADINTVGLWHMNEASGTTTVADSSGNGYNATSASSTNVGTGRLGNARTFNGTSENIIVGSTPITTATTNITFEAWVYWYDTSGIQMIFYNGSSNTNGYGIVINNGSCAAGNQVTILLGNVSCNPTSSTYTLPQNTWTHIAFTRDSTTWQLYINGVLTGTSTTNPNAPTVGTAFGSSPQTPYVSYFHGIIDEARFSNIARSPEEIKQDAQRFPYAVYTSPSIDLCVGGCGITGFTSLQWTAQGIRTGATGAGETLISTSGLLAQWKFNETSGTSAADSSGNSVTGTLQSFTNTTGQDVLAGSGWTANNARWGAGALMFNGSSNYVSAADTTLPSGNSTISVATWFKTSLSLGASSYQTIFNYGTQASGQALYFGVANDTHGANYFYVGPYGFAIYSLSTVNDGNWHHAAATYDGTTWKLYIDGVLNSTSTTMTTNLVKTGTAYIGKGPVGANNWYWNGVIDNLTVYNRALTAGEILANYQAGNIEFQTRTSADNATWEAWKPTTGETQIQSFDSAALTAVTNCKGLYHFENNGNADASCGTNLIIVGTITYATSNPSPRAGSYSASGFSTSNHYTIPNAVLPAATSGTIEFFWAPGNLSANQYVWYATDGTNASYFYVDTSGVIHFKIGAGAEITSTASVNQFPSLYLWYHLGMTWDGTNWYVYKDGLQIATGARAQTMAATIAAYIGINTGPANPLTGFLDEFRVVSVSSGTAGALSAATIAQDSYLQDQDKGSHAGVPITQNTDATTYLEGTGSEKLTLGAPQVDANTVGLWHMEETSGTGAYIKDSTTNANNGTPTGTSVVDGFYGKGRSFNGSTDLIDTGNTFNSLTNNFSISLWVKPGASQVQFADIFGNQGGNCPGGNFCGFVFQQNSTTTNQYAFAWGDGSAWQITGYFNLTANVWQHVAVTKSSSGGTTVYVNGASAATLASNTAVSPSTYTLKIGQGYAAGGRYFAGSVDEFKIDTVVRTAEEVAEAYRAGRDHRLGLTISSTNLSSATKIPFYVAADRPGRYLEATIGNNAYDNYEPDANTSGLWHLEEMAGSGAYLKDSSSNGNNGTPTGTTFVQGKIGKARSFNGTSDYISLPVAAPSLPITIDMWVNPTSSTPVGIFDSAPNTANTLRNYPAGYVEWWNASPQVALNLTANTWQHLAFVFRYDGTNRWIDYYKNGILQTSASTATNNTVGWTNFTLGNINGGTAGWYSGIIDEFRISSGIARSAADIRAAYEIGRRTHSINIDFVTTPQAAYSSGTSVTLNNPWGTTNLTDTLKVGDTIVFKENVNGTLTVSQATVNAITNTSTTYGTVTLAAAPTFPSGGYSTNARVFKWQREYFDPTGSLGSQINGVTRITIRDTDGSQGANVWLDDLRYSTGYIGSNTPSSFNTTTGVGTYSSTSVTSTAQRYFQYRAIFSSWDTPVAPSLTSVTINYNYNYAPAVPTISSPTNGATNVGWAPAITLSTTDTEVADPLQYKLQLATDNGFTQNLQTFDQTSSQTGWSGQNVQAGAAYSSGSTATYTIQTSLSENTTYYLGAYAIDPSAYGGSGVWSAVSSTISFTTKPLAAPTNCSVYPTGSATTAHVAWTNNAVGAANNLLERSVGGGAYALYQTLSASAISYDDTGLANGTYQYRVRAFASNNTYSAYCTTGTITFPLGETQLRGVQLRGVFVR